MPPKNITDTGGALYLNGEKLCDIKEMTPTPIEPIQDSWEIDGDCSICRRKKYCSKMCKKARLRRDLEIKQLLYQGIARRMLGKRGGVESGGEVEKA